MLAIESESQLVRHSRFGERVVHRNVPCARLRLAAERRKRIRRGGVGVAIVNRDVQVRYARTAGARTSAPGARCASSAGAASTLRYRAKCVDEPQVDVVK